MYELLITDRDRPKTYEAAAYFSLATIDFGLQLSLADYS